MYKSISVTLFCFFILFRVYAQDLYMPRDIQRAYKKETRSFDGKPGKKYWQNHARYIISVTALPPDRTVKGTELITYFNNSPDTLRSLNMKFILNIHRAGAPRFYNTPLTYLSPGMQIDTFLVNGVMKNWNNDIGSGTNQPISLKQPMLPHDSVKLNITWHYQIATQSAREGMIDSTSWYLAYFYPRVAVYDDYNGWDMLPFLDAQEFYNDFNDYTLHVTVPKNYIVWATGTLQNTGQVLQPEYVKRLEQSMTSDSTIHIATAEDIAKKSVTMQNPLNTWTWKAANITDMAVGLSNHYDWDAASTVVDNTTHRRASMQAAFSDDANDFHHAVQFGINTINWLSNNLPGIPYPFPKMTAFQGFGDMEYPMMVNDTHNSNLLYSQLGQDHEIAHTYFPFYMGTNESRYAFMDEGWATALQYLIGVSEIGKERADPLFKQYRIVGWIKDASSAEDLPIITPSSELRYAYNNNSYGKPALSYLALADLLGDELFKKALHVYMSNWNGKHPIPWDFFNSMNSGSGKNLNWFFNNWFFTNYYIDLDLRNVVKSGDGYLFSVRNIGGFAVPFDIVLTYADGTSKSFHQTPAVWQRNQKQTAVFIKAGQAITSAKVDGGIFMDADESNNTWIAR